MANSQAIGERDEINYPAEMLEKKFSSLTVKGFFALISLFKLLENKLVKPRTSKGQWHIFYESDIISTTLLPLTQEPIKSFWQFLLLKLEDDCDLFFRSLLGVIESKTFNHSKDADVVQKGFAALNLIEPIDMFQAANTVRWREKYVSRVVNEKTYRWKKERAELFVSKIRRELDHYFADHSSKINDLQRQIQKAVDNIKTFEQKTKDVYTCWSETFFNDGELQADESLLCEFFYLAEAHSGGWQQKTEIFRELEKYFDNHQEVIYLKQIIELLNAPKKPKDEADKEKALLMLNGPHDVIIPLFLEAERKALEGKRKFSSGTRCGAFCWYARKKGYFITKETEPNKLLIDFADARYELDISAALASGKAKQRELDKHINQIIKGQIPLRNCFQF